MKKIIFILLFGSLLVQPAFCITIRSSLIDLWKDTNLSNAEKIDIENFIIKGSKGDPFTPGTFDDEGAVVGLVAMKIADNGKGGYFCPLQIQCANKRKETDTWLRYFKPANFNEGQCAWLCADGYYGNDCANSSEQNISFCDSKSFQKNGDRYVSLKMKTSGGADDEFSDFMVFNTFTKEWDVKGEQAGLTFLGVVGFKDHGVIAQPLHLYCDRNNWEDNDSFIREISGDFNDTEAKLLCAEGYKLNNAKDDCEAVDACKNDISNMNYCNNFDEEDFDEDEHYLVTDSGCVKYFCKESGKAFRSVTDKTCIDCAEGSKGGTNSNNGTCISCDTGQYFDEDDGICKTAVAYSKSDMQYGKGETKNTVPLDEQCWLIATPEEYAECVKNDGKRPISPSNSTQIMTQSIF